MRVRNHSQTRRVFVVARHESSEFTLLSDATPTIVQPVGLPIKVPVTLRAEHRVHARAVARVRDATIVARVDSQRVRIARDRRDARERRAHRAHESNRPEAISRDAPLDAASRARDVERHPSRVHAPRRSARRRGVK